MGSDHAGVNERQSSWRTQFISGILFPIILALLAVFGSWIMGENFPSAIYRFVGIQPNNTIVDRFGSRGKSDGKTYEGEYRSVNSGAQIASKKEYPFCSLSTVSINSSGNCSIWIKDGSWTITVTGNAECKVMCFK